MTKIVDMKAERYRRPDEYPYFIEVHWNERGVDEDGVDFQRIEGYGFDDEIQFHKDLDELVKGEWKGQVERLTISFNPCSTRI